MTLRIKTLLLLLCIVSGLIGVLYFTSTLILNNTFQQLEAQDANRNLTHVQEALQAMQDQLTRTAQDYAVWDDTYAFIQDGNRTYIDANMLNETFLNLGVNLIVYVRPGGEIVYSRFLDLNTQQDIPIPQELNSYLTANSPLVHHLDTESEASGYILLPQGAVMVASHPILTSQVEGPIRGALILGRLLDANALPVVAKQLQLDLSTALLSDLQMPTDFLAVRAAISDQAPVQFRNLSGDSSAGYFLLKDVAQNPIAILRVAMSRTINLQRLASTRSVFYELLVVGVLLGLLALILLNRIILRPMTRLYNEIYRVGQRKDVSDRIVLKDARDEFGRLGTAVNNLLAGLEEAQGLNRRLIQMRTAAEISRNLSSVLDMKSLLQQVVDLVCKRFDLYYAGVFMVDELGREAVLRAGTGEAGQKMMAEHHHLPVGGNSMIGWSIANRQARKALDVGQEAVRFNNPHLPLTRSELALPIRVGERVLGAVTVQSERPQAFDEEDIVVLQGIADGLAIALENARLFAQAQSDYKEIQALHRQYLSQSWNELSARQQVLEYTYQDGEQTLLDEDKSSVDASPSLAIPLRLRDQVIGSLTLDKGPQELSPEDQTFVNAVVAQAALALENARLLENARRQAEKERIVTEVASKAWSNADIETILQTSLEELGNRLNASQGWIHLEMKE